MGTHNVALRCRCVLTPLVRNKISLIGFMQNNNNNNITNICIFKIYLLKKIIWSIVIIRYEY